jgi:hypothetical protein
VHTLHSDALATDVTAQNRSSPGVQRKAVNW